MPGGKDVLDEGWLDRDAQQDELTHKVADGVCGVLLHQLPQHHLNELVHLHTKLQSPAMKLSIGEDR